MMDAQALCETLGVVRWGETQRIKVLAGTTFAVKQFVDYSGYIPQVLEIYFVSTSTVPIAGLSVRYKLQLGVGSTNHEENFTVLVQDELAQTPLVLRRPASTVQISAHVINTLPEDRIVAVTAMLAPVTIYGLR